MERSAACPAATRAAGNDREGTVADTPSSPYNRAIAHDRHSAGRFGRIMLSPVLVLASEVEAAGRAVIATDAAGSIIYWGRGARELFGWTDEEALGRHILDVTPTDLSREDAEDVMETLIAGDPWSGDFLVRSKAGDRFLIRVTDIPVHDGSGRLLGIVGISRLSTGASRVG
jgi:PAS domain S-box-containing protein